MAKYSLCLFLFFLWFCLNGFNSIEGVEVVEAKNQQKHHDGGGGDSMHTIQLTTLFPSTTCNSAPKAKGDEKQSTVKIVHKHGPCFQTNKIKPNTLNHIQILLLDQRRVESIQSRYSKTLHGSDVIEQTDSANIPAKDGRLVGAGNYIVTVGFGTPKKDLSLIFDTGSDLTWTQCRPCAKFCYDQKETIFDPRLSKTYTNISCSTALCNSLGSATGNTPACSSSTCVYGIQYGDSSFSVGFFGKETLTLTPTDIFPNFYFGCGQNNKGLFGGAAGLIGLGRDKLSLVSQTATKYKQLFSYCLPSSPSTTGHLTFGGGIPGNAQFTPLSSTSPSSSSSSFYGLDVIGITVGGKKLSIPATVFSSSGTIIDSGTVITRLPPTAYGALKTTFRQFMSKYPSAPALSILDTCYDLSKYQTITVPKIAILFSGGSQLNVDQTGIFYVNNPSQVCLAFAPNGDNSDLGILGNTQQKTLEVVYDVGGGRVGFASAGCK